MHALSDLYRYHCRISLSKLLLLISLNSLMFEFAEEIEERHNSTDSECAVFVIQVSSIIDLSTGLKNNDDEFVGYPVIGYHESE